MLNKSSLSILLCNNWQKFFIKPQNKLKILWTGNEIIYNNVNKILIKTGYFMNTLTIWGLKKIYIT